ncbi:hypothetical protein, partial [Sphingorhabdus sp.]
MQNALIANRNYTRWKVREASEKTNVPQRIDIPDSFYKSKRNLLWACAIALLVFFGSTTKNDAIQLPGLQYNITEKAFYFSIFVYIIYSALAFYQEWHFAKLLNSEAAKDVDSKDLRSFIKNTQNNIEGYISKIESINSKLEISMVKIENPEINDFVYDNFFLRDTRDIENRLTINFDNISTTCINPAMKFIEDPDERADAVGAIQQEILALRIEIQKSIEEIKNFKIQRANSINNEKYSQYINSIKDAQLELQKYKADISVVRELIRDISSSFMKLSSQSAILYRSMFYVHDGAIPVIMTAVSIY